MHKVMRLMCVILLIVLFFTMVGCRSAETVKIGLLVDISGKSSSLGITARDAALLAVEQHNEANFGASYEVVVKDTKGDAARTREMVQSFVNEGVQMVIGPITSGETDDIRDYFASGELVFLSPTVSTDDLTGIDDYMFRVIGAARLQVETLAHAAYDIDGNDKVAIIYEQNNTSFGEPMANRFNAITKKRLGSDALVLDYDSNATKDFSVYIEELLKHEADGVIFIGPSEDTSVFLQQLALAEFEGNKYLTMWSNTNNLVAESGSAVDGVYITAFFHQELMNEAMHDYEKMFSEKFGYKPGFIAYNVDEACEALFQAFEANQYYDADNIKEALSQGLEVDGYSSSYTIDKYGDSNKPYILMQFEGQKLQRVD